MSEYVAEDLLLLSTEESPAEKALKKLVNKIPFIQQQRAMLTLSDTELQYKLTHDSHSLEVVKDLELSVNKGS